MTEQERIDAIAQNCRSSRYPEAAVKTLTGYLSGQGTLEQAQQAWQTAQADKRHPLFPTFLLSDASTEQLDALDVRILDFCAASEQVHQFLYVVQQEERLHDACDYLLSQGITEQQQLRWLLELLGYAVDQAGQLPRLGQRLLTFLPDQFAEICALLEERIRGGYWCIPLMRLLTAAEPPYLDLAWQVTEQAQRHETPDNYLVGACASLLLKADPVRFTAWTREIASWERPDSFSRVVALQALLEQDVAQHIDLAVAAAHTPVSTRNGRTFIPYQLTGLKAAYTFDPVTYWPLVEEAALGQDAQLGHAALQLLAGASFDQVRPLLQRCVSSAPVSTALAALELLLKTPWEGQQAALLMLLAHRRKQIRDRNSTWLAAQGEAISDEIAPFLTRSRAATRLAAVQTLERIGGARAQRILKARLASEKAQRIQECILDVVGWPGAVATAEGTRPASIEAITAEAEATLPYLPKSTLAWFDVQEAPALCWNTGDPVPPVVLRYLLYRQVRWKGTQVEERNRQTLRLLDRATAGDLARALFTGWVSNGAPAEEAWLLPLVGALGDERLAQHLRQRIESWGLGTRRALAVRAIQALALLEGEAAQAELNTLANVFTYGQLQEAVRQALAS